MVGRMSTPALARSFCGCRGSLLPKDLEHEEEEEKSGNRHEANDGRSCERSCSLSVPFQPRHAKVDMLTMLRSTVGENMYMQRWQSSEEGEAEADFAKHGSEAVLAKILCTKSPVVSQSRNGKPVMECVPLPDQAPTWLKDEDLQYYVDSFDKTGFTGGFNLYRNIRRTWEPMAPWSNLGINTPSLFACGDQDLCITMFHDYITGPAYKQAVPNLKNVVTLPGVGHFVAEEEPEQVSNLLLRFCKGN